MDYNTEEEVWKDVKGYEGYYQVSNLGQVRSLDRTIPFRGGEKKLEGMILKQKLNKGYNMVGLSVEGKQQGKLTSRLVAEAFIVNSENKPEVNHIDENKQNNMVENLEWVTPKENSNHGTRNSKVIPYLIQNGQQREKSVAMINKESNELIQTFKSINEACRALGVTVGGGISKVCKGINKTAYGYKWKYADN